MSKKTTQKIPELRFPEFIEEWKTIRLQDVFSEFKSGQGITSSQIYEEGEFPVFGGNGLRGYTNTFTHEGYYLLVGRQGALCGNINRATGKVYISEHAIAGKANDYSDTEWLAQRLDYLNLNKLSESSAQPGLSVNKLLRLKLVVPDLKEQKKIANFLTAVDKNINLLTQKKTLLEQYKKGVMQKIFNQEIRFQPDSQEEQLAQAAEPTVAYGNNQYPDWEVKKLGDLGEIITGKTPSTKEANLWNGEIQFVTPTDINENKYQYETQRKIKKIEKTKILPPKSILFTCIASIGKMSLSVYPCVTNQQINSIVPLKRFDNEFIYYSLLNIVDYIKSTQSTNTLPIINKSEFSKLKIRIPKNIEEQQKIATFLSALDDKIEHVQTQIDHYTTWKKGLLQRMFI